MSPFYHLNSASIGMDSKAVIKRNFSRHASRYDRFSLIQDKVGTELLARVQDRRPKRILDIGCGTGTFTRAVAQSFGHARMTALDLCPAMIKAARQKLGDKQVRWICADAETVVLPQQFDLIVSNACFQWFDDLSGTVQRYRQSLVPEGILAFSAFGPSTYWELSQVIRTTWGEPVNVHSHVFPALGVYKTILQNAWAHVSIQETIHCMTYDSIWDLLMTIKYTGTKGHGLVHRTLNRAHIRSLEQAYRTCFGQIQASYQVFYCVGVRKD